MATTKTEVKIPKLGLTMTSARVVEWAKAVGDTVTAGEILATVEIDKAVQELEAPVSGRVEAILVAADPEVEHDVGTIIAIIESSSP